MTCTWPFLVTVAVLFSRSGQASRDPTYLTSAVGESVVLNCEVDFPHDVPVPYILRWNKEGSQIFSWNGPEQTSVGDSYRGRVSRLQGSDSNLGRGAVNLTSIRESDEGWYECQVFFPNRNPPMRPNGTWFHLSVEGGKLLAIPPINQTAQEGETARFNCVPKEAGSTVTWSRDGVLLEQIAGLWARSKVDANGTLTIKPTEHTDPGLFRCEVSDEQGETQAAGAHLNVLYKAKVVLAPPEQFLAYGRHGRLDCHFRANPPLTYLRWEKDGFLFDPYNVPGVFLLHNGSLSFEHVDESHAGVYNCAPYNALGSAGTSSPMSVVVQRPPVFTLRPSNLYVRRVGDGVDMACAAIEEGDPEYGRPPSVYWTRKDGSALPIGRHVVTSGNLTLQGLRREDSGKYLCTASNEAAKLVTETELLVEESVSRAPHSLAANASHDGVALKWSPGANVPAQQTHVWYRRADASEWRTIRVAAGAREVVIAPLKPGSFYEVMVTSRDEDGEGMMSKPLRVHTKGVAVKEELATHDASVSAGTPRNVSVQTLGSSWLVTWAPPERVRGKSGYTVRWRQHVTGGSINDSALPEDLWEPQGGGAVDTDDTWLLVRGLEEGGTYVFEVESRGGGGASGQAIVKVEPGQRTRGARAVILAALVAAILLIAVAVASWHGGRVCGKRGRNKADNPSDTVDHKVYDALVSRLQPPSISDNVWVAPNTLNTSVTAGAANYPRDSFD